MTAPDAIAIHIPQPGWAREFERAVERFETYRDDLPPMPLSYTRSLLYRAHDFEIVAMRWAAGSVSPIHDHGTSRCWALIVEGELFIENFDRLDEDDGAGARIAAATSCRYTPGMLDHRLGWRELHRVRNTGESDAFSIQLYAQPLSRFHIFEEHGARVWETLAKYDATVALTR